MSVELKYLALTALLTASLWIPYVVAQVMTNGSLNAAKLRRSDAPAGAVLGSARAPRLPQCRRDVRALCGAGDRDPARRQERRHDRVLGNELFLDTRRPRGGFPRGHPFHPHHPVRAGMDLRHRAVRRTDEVADRTKGASRARFAA